MFPASAPPLLFVCLDVGAIESQIVWEEQRSSSRSSPAEIPAAVPGFVAWVEVWCALLAVIECLLVRDVVWCQGDANSVQNRLKSLFSSFHLFVSAASSVTSVRGA